MSLKSMQKKAMNDIFIAHVEEDAEVALTIALGLEQLGFRTWCYEAHSVPGPSYLIQTGQAVEQAKAVVVIVSPHSLGSKQITKEIVRAHEDGKEFIPVRKDISHVEFQNRQPEWREAFGAASSISLTSENLSNVIYRIVEGLKALGIGPVQPDQSRIQVVKEALNELEKGLDKSKVARLEEQTRPPEEKVLATRQPYEKPLEGTKRIKRKRIIIGAAAGGFVVVASIIAILLTGVFVKYALNMQIFPEGSGSVSPSGGSFSKNTRLTLTATPSGAFIFDGWGGDIAGTSSAIDIVMNKNISASANFKRLYALGTSLNPAGGGVINFSPEGGIYKDGTKVVLTAVPAVGFTFGGWGGDANGSSLSITVSMDAEKHVTANFKAVYALRTSVNPTAAGKVTPEGSTYEAGKEVQLTAIPAEGYAFSEWSGDITGKSPTITVSMDRAKNIVANFKAQYALTVAVTPDRAGTITPGGGFFDANSQVKLTATAVEGFIFSKWSGDVTGDSPSITISMDQKKDIIAIFNEVLFEDQFIDNRNNWYTGSNSVVSGGVLTLVIDPPLGKTQTRKIFKWLDGAPQHPDFGFEADVITLQPDSDPYKGIFFLADPRKSETNRPEREFVFIINGNEGKYALSQDTSTGPNFIVNWTASPFINKGMSTNSLKVMCRNSVIELYANNHLLTTITNQFPEALGDNGIGVVISGSVPARAAYDNVKMWAITD
jgi:hypothetical protein